MGQAVGYHKHVRQPCVCELAITSMGLLPRWLSGKNPPAIVEARGDSGSVPGSGRSPGEGNGNALQYYCQNNPTDRGAWRATDHGVAKSETWLSGCTCTHTFKESDRVRMRSPSYRRVYRKQHVAD